MTALGWEAARALLFRLDAELAHDLSLAGLAAVGGMPSAAPLLGEGPVRTPRLAVRTLGLAFANPLGVAAGLDKGARVPGALGRLGFGAVEVGTVTPRPQPGNPRPRAFRLPRDRALVNRFGFNSDGALVVGARLRDAGAPPEGLRIGVNVGKNRDTPPDRAADDHVLALRRIGRVGDWVTINLSSPNTPGLRDLQGGRALAAIVSAVVAFEADSDSPRPVLVKLAPDLAPDAFDAAVDRAVEAGAVGLVIANTTIARPASLAPSPSVHEAGGLSGPPLLPRTRELVARVHRRTAGEVSLVGVGGVSSGEDAWALVRAGATLVQAYTGFVHGGPAWPRRVLEDLDGLCERAGAASVAEVVGRDA